MAKKTTTKGKTGDTDLSAAGAPLAADGGADASGASGGDRARGDGAKSGPGKGKGKAGEKAGVGGGEAGGGSGGGGGKQLVIVESPAKAKTINKYLGPQYTVMASVGHVRDLPAKNPKGDKSPVPGVNLEKGFAPTYEVLAGKSKTITELKRAARTASEVWFATDLDREGEAIAWHLADELGIDPARAKRVVFSAITKGEIQRAFSNPHPINMDRVNAQQARRILDRIVGYQVSPLLWKKVARGLSAGRVQSVAVRLVVEREREIRAFVPEEYWQIGACFTPEQAKAAGLAREWEKISSARNEKGEGPTLKRLNEWLGAQGGFRAEVVEVCGEKVERILGDGGGDGGGSGAAANGAPGNSGVGKGEALAARAREVAELAGLKNVRVRVTTDEKGRGPAKFVREIAGEVDVGVGYRVRGIETKRTTSRPPAPYITSTLQQAASSRLGFGARRTMQAAQALYEGVDVPGEGPVGLITYMRTDSTHLAPEAVAGAREYIGRTYGERYLPEKPNVYTSSNKDAQEAHEAIRPTSLAFPPAKVKNALKPDQLRLYTLIWERFVACQMATAQWDATAVTIVGGRDPARPVALRATGRVLVFDGFYRVAGVPGAGDEQHLPALRESQPVWAIGVEARQKFTQPPARYSEASLIRMLESEGIGRPSTYASIIQVIQDRKYVEQVDRRFYATDLGEVVTDKLIEGFPQIMDVGYTRDMEAELDKVEDDHIDWVRMLERFYGPFKQRLEHALENLSHAKAETQPAPKELTCPKCATEGRGVTGLVYRFGRNGRFLSCSRFPECDYACPVDREGRPRPVEQTNIACPRCGAPMTKRTGRFGPFLGCSRFNEKTNPCDMILRFDKKGLVVAPSQPPVVTELACAKCSSPMNLRSGVRGPWLGCSRFPKCRGRTAWTSVPEATRAALVAQLEAHEKANPVLVVRTLDGLALTDEKGKPIVQNQGGDAGVGGGGDGTLESVAEEMGV